MEESNFYVYRHRRLDNNSIFYIGMGRQANFLRAKTQFGRNDHWVKLVDKVGFDYEILATNLSKEQAWELEVFLIILYGRHDLGTGRLVNKTDGGDGVFGYKLTEEDRKKLSYNSALGKNRKARKVIDTQTKVIYDCIKEASIALGIPESTMRCYINGNMTNITFCIYLEDYTGVMVKPTERKQYLLVLNTENGVYHDTITEASVCYGIKRTTLNGALRGKFKNNTPLIIV